MVRDFIIGEALWILWGIAITIFLCVENIQNCSVDKSDRLEKHVILGAVTGLVSGGFLCLLAWKKGYSLGFLFALGPLAGLVVATTLDNWL